MASNKQSTKLRIFRYDQLRTYKREIINDLHNQGFIAVNNVPGFAEAYQRFISASRDFISLPLNQQAEECTPSDSYARGWSRGVEVFNNKKDSYKGSYYAYFPESASYRNIWPRSIPSFQTCYTEVTETISRVGKEVLSLLLTNQKTSCVARMLHYSAISEGEDDGNPNWCGLHKDHGLFTGLGPEVYFLHDAPATKPDNSGLYILDQAISSPSDVILFQVGEALELATNGKTAATEHFVRKAYGGYERFTLAVFFQPDENFVLSCDREEIVAKYADRYSPDLTYRVWNERSLLRYNPDFRSVK